MLWSAPVATTALSGQPSHVLAVSSAKYASGRRDERDRVLDLAEPVDLEASRREPEGERPDRLEHAC